jgi:riboflavin biosynthesis pyrimidine reductase
LSSGRGLDPAHPAFHGPTRPLLFVPAEAAAELRERFARTEVHVASVPQPSARLALDHLRRLGAKRITIEAGPTTARKLYDEPARVDELWLATYAGAAPPSDAIGEPFLEDARLAATLPDASAQSTRVEPSGPWHFQRRAAT